MQKLNSAAELPGQFLTQLDNLGAIRLSGEEAEKYLQGQVTIDMELLTEQQALMGSHCDFKGKAWNIFYAAGTPDDITLICHKGAVEGSLAELKKYGVFSKVDIKDISDRVQIFGGSGEQLEAYISGVFGSLPQSHLGSVQTPHGQVIALDKPSLRYLLVLDAPLAQSLKDHFTDELFDNSGWEVLDIQAGLPNIQQQTSNEFVPQMMNLQSLNAISFDKGCYMGQEVVARTKFLGKNKRASYILKGQQAADLAAGDTLEMQIGDNWRRGGTVLRSASLENESWVLAVLPNDTEVGATFRNKENPQQTFNVLPLPYELEQ